MAERLNDHPSSSSNPFLVCSVTVCQRRRLSSIEIESDRVIYETRHTRYPLSGTHSIEPDCRNSHMTTNQHSRFIYI